MDYEETMYYMAELKKKEAYFRQMIPAEQYDKYRDMFMRFDTAKAYIITTPMRIEEIEAEKLGKYITPMMIAIKGENGTIIGK